MTFLRLLRPLLVAAAVTLILWERRVVAFTHQTIRPLQFSSIGTDTSQTPTHCSTKSRRIFAVPPPGGLSFEEEQASVATVMTASQKETETSSSSAGKLKAGSITSDNNVIATTNNNVNDSSPSPPRQIRGKLNEIDFCMSPSDVSLSRLYQTSPISQSVTSSQSQGNTIGGDGAGKTQNDLGAPRIMSLTRALNSASNRAVRRILLSRSWPSPEALNISLRQVLSSSSSFGNSVMQENRQVDLSKVSREEEKGEENTAKCPVPRPILNIIMKEQGWKVDKRGETGSEVMENDDLNVKGEEVPPITPLGRKGRTDEKWVEEQLKAFRETYGSVEGYPYAEAYMECILSLATSGVESERVSEVLQQGIYEDAYKRVISVLGSAGVTFEQVEGIDARMKMASKLRDDDICLSMLDKININNGGKSYISISEQNPSMAVDKQDEAEKQEEKGIDETGVETIEVSDKNDQDTNSIVIEDRARAEKPKGEKKMGNLFEMILSRMIKKNDDGNQEKEEVLSPSSNIEEEGEAERKVDVSNETEMIKPEDLGGVLLSKEEPTITRQLNVLSNIVKRTLLFGGDQEILVLSKTLEADRPAFIQRWYPETVKSMPYGDVTSETRPGVQFFNCIVQLLKDCYNNGVVTTLGPPLPLSASYTNSYERLTAMLAELGSGYVRPISDSKVLSKKPQSAREELIRFSQWEVSLRKTKPDVSNFPSDLVGSWQVKDQIGGKVIGISTIVFKPEGKIEVAPPLKGLKWRLDPGPTHLDTCTFQVLSEDGTILQYRGFMDRGARLESRFSKRSIKIRGTVSFQMRDSNKALIGEDFKRDLLPIESQPGTTRFVMSKVFDLNG
mmetsp:Transcript_5163/g.9820  ORF Transcript_5163/g.9820 Transcript_5163/m.9820 type:complete len:845 (-) Transcript_5163:40-2574(-)